MNMQRLSSSSVAACTHSTRAEHKSFGDEAHLVFIHASLLGRSQSEGKYQMLPRDQPDQRIAVGDSGLQPVHAFSAFCHGLCGILSQHWVDFGLHWHAQGRGWLAAP